MKELLSSYKTIIILTVAGLFPVIIYSQPIGVIIYTNNNYTITDLLNNEAFTYSTISEKLTNNRLGFFKNIDVEYPVFANLSDTSVQAKLNIRFRQILVEQLETDSFRAKLFRNMIRRLCSHCSNDYDNYNKDGTYCFTPDLKTVNFEFLSCFKSTVTFTINFLYRATHPSFSLDHDLSYSQTYYFNLINGKEYTPDDVFISTSEQEMIDLIEKEIVKNNVGKFIFRDQHNNMDPYDMQNYFPKQEKKLIDFSLAKDGFPFLIGFSMAYYIPDMEPCNETIFLNQKEVRLTFDQIREHLNPNGPFGSLINYKLADSTRLKNQNNPLFINKDFKLKLSEYDKPPLIIGDNIKTITIRKLKKVKTKDNMFQDSNIIVRKQDYLQSGHISMIREYYDTGLYSTETFEFNLNGQLKKTVHTSEYGVHTYDYTYDENNNLLIEARRFNNIFTERSFYYYTNDFAIKEVYDDLYRGYINSSYSRINFNDQGKPVDYLYMSSYEYSLGHPETVCKYDKKGRLLFAYSKNEDSLSGNIYVYDKKDNILSNKYNHGNSKLEYKYDKKNNIIMITEYYMNRVYSIRKACYDTKKRLVKIEVTNASDNLTPQVISIIYEYW